MLFPLQSSNVVMTDLSFGLRWLSKDFLLRVVIFTRKFRYKFTHDRLMCRCWQFAPATTGEQTSCELVSKMPRVCGNSQLRSNDRTPLQLAWTPKNCVSARATLTTATTTDPPPTLFQQLTRIHSVLLVRRMLQYSLHCHKVYPVVHDWRPRFPSCCKYKINAPTLKRYSSKL